MHTDPTLDILSQATMCLGKSVRDFQEKTCTMFQTRELERERAARQRRQEKKTANRGARSTLATQSDTTGESAITANHGTPAGAADDHREESTNSENYRSVPTPASSSSSTRAAANVTNSSSRQASKVASNNTRRQKLLNLNTYTYHALGDYVRTIRTFGTTDSYSTQPVSI
jgi:hypothetical protein